jgi:hypothetical protein
VVASDCGFACVCVRTAHKQQGSIGEVWVIRVIGEMVKFGHRAVEYCVGTHSGVDSVAVPSVVRCLEAEACPKN